MTLASPGLAQLVTSFFTRHLAAERDASPHTIVSYRDTFRLFLQHLVESTRRRVSRLTLEDLSPEAILDFLEDLELRRGNSISTRNARLAAIRSFFSYAVTQDAAVAALAQSVEPHTIPPVIRHIAPPPFRPHFAPIPTFDRRRINSVRGV